MGAVTVVIPNWNGARFLQPLLGQLARQSLAPDTVIVVDNGSTDASISIAVDLGADVIALPSNQGFAAAVNRGVQAAATPLVAVLNNDLQLHPDWLATLASALENPAYSFACGKVLSQQQPRILDGSFDLVSFAACPWRAGNGKADSPLWNEPRTITSLPFTAALIRRDVFLSLGRLDERFGSYLEDVSFSLAASAAGCRGIYVPSAVCYHAGSATLGRGSHAVYFLQSRNQVYLASKHFPTRFLFRHFWQILAGQLLWGLVAARRGRLTPWLRGKLHGLGHWRRLRRPPPDAASAQRLEKVLREQERLIAHLQQQAGWDSFWKWYFRLTGGPPRP